MFIGRKAKRAIAMGILSALIATPVYAKGIFDGITLSQGISILGGLTGQGLPAGSHATYTWQDGTEAQSYVMCQTGGSQPNINEEVSATCEIYIINKDMYSTPVPMQVATETFTSGGKNTLNVSFPIYKIAEYDNNKVLHKIPQTLVGQTYATVTVDVYSGQTGLDSTESSTFLPSDPMYANSDISQLADGVPVSVTEPGSGLEYDAGGARINDTVSTDPLDPNSGLTDATIDTSEGSLSASSPYSSNGTSSGYGDYINNALGDLADAFNSGDDDWLDSGSGNSGESSLDDYFNGVEYDGMDVPGGLTDDVLGVGTDIYGEDETQLGERQYAEGNLVGEGEGVEGEGGEGTGTEGTGIYVSEVPEQGEYSGGDANSEYGPGNLASVYAAGLGGLDGVSQSPMGDSSNSGLLGGITGSDASSIGKRLRRLVGNDPSVSGNVANASSEQELFDLAKNMLLSKGVNIEDMRKGANYSPNSAWTEPTLAWDFNRITRLLKRNKISLAGGNSSTKK